MFLNKFIQSWFPKQILWRLTMINFIVIAAFIVLSSWAIYNTACMLVDGMAPMDNTNQTQFNNTLFHYLWIFSITTIVSGSVVHFYLTKRLIHPLRKLIDSTKLMKKGSYPNPIKLESDDETGKLIENFNELVLQLKTNDQLRKKQVSDLSHEFRTPLSNLNGYLSALKNGVMDGNQQLYESLYEETKRLTNMVEQLEQLKEWDFVSHQKYYEKKSCDVAPLIEQAVSMFQHNEDGIPIVCKVGSKELFANPSRITQVISNLLDNAIRYYRYNEPIKIIGQQINNCKRAHYFSTPFSNLFGDKSEIMC